MFATAINKQVRTYEPAATAASSAQAPLARSPLLCRDTGSGTPDCSCLSFACRLPWREGGSHKEEERRQESKLHASPALRAVRRAPPSLRPVLGIHACIWCCSALLTVYLMLQCVCLISHCAVPRPRPPSDTPSPHMKQHSSLADQPHFLLSAPASPPSVSPRPPPPSPVMVRVLRLSCSPSFASSCECSLQRPWPCTRPH